MNRCITSSLALMLIAGHAAAVDTRYTDIRLGIGVAETPDKAHVEYDAGRHSAAPSSRGDVGFEHNIGGRIRLGIVHGRTTSWGGWFAGTGIELSGQRLELVGAGDDADFDNTSSSSARIYAEGGYAYAFTKRFHLELGPTVGAGVSSITWIDQQDDGRWTSEEGEGTSVAIGGRLGLYAQVTEHLVLGLTGGVERVVDRAEIEFKKTSEGKADVELRHTGAFAMFETGWRF